MLKRFLNRLVWTIGILLVAIAIAHALAVLYTGWRLEQVLAARREAGLPNSFQELATPSLPEEENAAVQMARAMPWATGINEELFEVMISTEFDEDELSDAAAQQVASLDDAYERMLGPLRRAVEMDRYQTLQLERLPLDPSEVVLDRLMDYVVNEREISRAFHARMLLLTKNGRREEAFDLACLNLQVARLMANEPMLTGNLVAIACQRWAANSLAKLVAREPLTAHQREKLDGLLAKEPGLAPLQATLNSEAVFSFSKTFDLMPGWVGRPLVQRWQHDTLTYLTDRHMQLANEHHGMSPIVTLNEPALATRFPVLLLHPAIDHCVQAAYRQTARERCLRVMIALQAALAERPQDLPAIDALELPPEALRDPFAQGPLRLKHTDAGWLIYSVGSDGVDHGGAFDKEADVGYLLTLPAAETPGK